MIQRRLLPIIVPIILFASMSPDIFAMGFNSEIIGQPTYPLVSVETQLKEDGERVAIDVSAGGMHSCALTAENGVQCWGNNQYGQLGIGTTTDSNFPIDVSGFSSGVKAISAGGTHTCALTIEGGVKCWGGNFYGQLGDNTLIDQDTPMQVDGLLSGVTAISAGDYYTCALTSQGGVKCWGWNSGGQLGNGTTVDQITPVEVTGLSSGVSAISAGVMHTCALTSQGGVKCWGRNDSGELGNNSTNDSPLPVDVVGLTSGVSAITTGGTHTCALTSQGGVKCWGGNWAYQLGDDTTTTRSTPVDVVGLSSGVINISTGDYHTCALTSEGRVTCWGRNVNGELGNGTATPSAKLESVVGLAGDVRSISSGWEHTCVLTGQGGVQCWGRNAYGALGNGMTTDHLSPVEVAGLSSGVSAISTGLNHTCIVMNAGGVKCWGLNWNRQLGNGMAAPSGIPVDVVDLVTGVKAITAGDYHTCALMSQGGVKCWGWNGNGELGDSTMTTRDTPVDVKNIPNGINAITTGGTHTCALTSQGGVKCWGRNANGELGNGTNACSTIPVEVAGLTSGVNAIAAGGTHNCALTSEGGVKCWGGNLDGQLGNDTTTDSSNPVDVVGLTSGVKAITAGDSHTCAVTTQGNLKCWGRNDSGQLGNKSTTGSPLPVDVVGLSSGVRTVDAGQTHTCALMDEGGVKCWGGNLHGQLGNGTTVDQIAPVEVTGFSSGVSALSAGGMHTCALTSEGGVKCWGDGSYGQLANGPLSWNPVNLSGFVHPLMIFLPSVLR